MSRRRRARPARGLALLALLAPLLTSCRTYRPVELAEVGTRDHIRVAVSPARAEALEGMAVPRDHGLFEAIYLGRSASGVELAVPMEEPAPDTRTRSVHTRVRIPEAELTVLEARRISPLRTAGAVAAGAVALVFGWGLF